MTKEIELARMVGRAKAIIDGFLTMKSKAGKARVRKEAKAWLKDEANMWK